MSFLASIAACGACGIFFLVIGNIGWLGGRILGTTSIFGAASILGLASAVPWERRRWHPIGPAGMGAVAVALVLVLIAIWIEPSWRQEWFYDLLGVACVIGVALPHAGLLSLARLRPQYRWVRVASVTGICLLASLITVVILTEPRGDKWFRGMGALAIVVVCGTIAMPIMHRVSAIRVRESVTTVQLALSITCPRCDLTQELSVGRSKCASCSLGFRIEIEEAQCRTCGYPLHGLESAVCPECGTPLSQSQGDG